MMTIESFFQRYAERYMAGDAAAVADMCGVPFLAIRAGTPIHLLDRDGLTEHLAGLMVAYQAAGAAAADIADLVELSQGDSAMLVTVRWHIRSASGALVRELRTSYQLVGPDPWLIYAYVNHDAVRAR